MPTPTPSHILNAMARIARPVFEYALKVLTEVMDEMLGQAQVVSSDSISR